MAGKPINYYIQLTDNISQEIDNLSQVELLQAAERALYCHNHWNKRSHFRQNLEKQTVELAITNEPHEFARDELSQLAHGLLAKATS